MSGHSKWATIKHKKGAADKARGKLFAKLIRQAVSHVGAPSPTPPPCAGEGSERARQAARRRAAQEREARLEKALARLPEIEAIKQRA